MLSSLLMSDGVFDTNSKQSSVHKALYKCVSYNKRKQGLKGYKLDKNWINTKSTQVN
jgi:hypothetical protein